MGTSIEIFADGSVATQDSYRLAIERQVELRRHALAEITHLTQSDYDADLIIQHAENALQAIRQMRKLKAEMRAYYPPQCGCRCHVNEEA